MQCDKVSDIVGEQCAVLAGGILQERRISPPLQREVIDIDRIDPLLPQVRREVGVYVLVEEQR